MSCILNLENLGVQVRRKTGAKTPGRLLNFGKAKASTANVRKVLPGPGHDTCALCMAARAALTLGAHSAEHLAPLRFKRPVPLGCSM